MNTKLRVSVLFPFQTLSGYGRRSLDLLRSLVELKWDEWDFHITSLPFGQSPFIQLDTNDPINAKIMSRVLPVQQVLSEMSDIGFFCTVPSELVGARIAKYQVLFTAGIESTLCSPDFIKGYNSMDLVITSSKHAMEVFKNTEWTENAPNGAVGNKLKINKVGEVLFEGIDNSKYNRKNIQSFDLSDIEEDWNFLIHGMLLPGDFTNPYGHDRKNILTTIKAFLETFKNKQYAPGLILKINAGSYSLMDQEHVIKKINEVRASVDGNLPNTYLIHGQLIDEEVIGLYQNPKIKVMLSVAAEGWGRTPIEFMCTTSKPIIAAPYGGMLDYVDKEFTMMVGGSLQPMHPSAVNQFLIKESQIFYPDINHLSGAMTEVYSNYQHWMELAKRQAHKCRTEFSLEAMTDKLESILDANIPKFARPVPIKLPPLKKINLEESK